MTDAAERRTQHERANRSLTDLPNVDSERAARLERAGLGSMDALASASPKEIAEASGLSGMDAIIAKEQASRSVEARRERSVTGRVEGLVRATAPRMQQQARMWVTAQVRRMLRGGR